MRAQPRLVGWINPRVHYPSERFATALTNAAFAAAVLFVLLTARAAGASGLLQMASGAGDMALSGAAIAETLSPSGALFANPAALAGFPRTTASGSLGVGFGHERITTDTGYDRMNDVTAMMPDWAISVARPNGWHYAVGMYGSVGISYDFPPAPDAGITSRYYSECSIAAMPFAVAKRVHDRLWLGAEISPMLGYMRNIYRVSDIPFHYKLIGPGVQGMVGATWKPDDHWGLGLAVRTPGRVWMDGSDEVPSGGRQDVDLEVKLPTQIMGGAEHRFTERLRVMTSLRWTDASTFGSSRANFSAMPTVRPAFVPDAEDEWRAAIGVRYAWAHWLELRAGFAYSTRIVGTNGASALLYDNNHVAISVGGAYTGNDWTFEFTAGLIPFSSRDVDANEALVFPGNYESGGGMLMLGLQRRF